MLVHVSQILGIRQAAARTHVAGRVAGYDHRALSIARAAGRTVFPPGSSTESTAAATKATIEREATRAWADQQRAAFGLSGQYENADLALGFIERRNVAGYRTRYPMWKKVVFLDDRDVDPEEAAQFLGTDAETYAVELSVAQAHLRA